MTAPAVRPALGFVGLGAGRDANAMLPLAALAHPLFPAASDQGQGRADDSHPIRVFRQLNDRP